MHLDGLRVLITRPAGRADDLARAVAAAGGNSVQVPLLTVSGLDRQGDTAVWQRTDQYLQRLAHYRYVIAISVNAVHYGMPRIAAALQQRGLPHALQLPASIDWYGIGAATIGEFSRWGIAARGGSAGTTSEALLALPDLRSVHGAAILILRGVGGRETLAAVLRERGALVDYAECYRRSAPQLDQSQQQLLQRAAFDAVCVNSAETLRNLWHYLSQGNSSLGNLFSGNVFSENLPQGSLPPEAGSAATALQMQYQRIPLIVPSERVAQLAASLGFLSIVSAANAGTAATLTALQEVNKQRAIS